MKHFLLYGVFTFFTMSTITYAFTGFGGCNFVQENRNTVICYGSTMLKNTKVAGDVKVAGILRSFDSTMGPLTIKGAAYIRNSTISGTSNIVGDLNAINSNFQSDIAITSRKANLNHSTVNGNITMSSRNAAPSLTLECKSIVKSVKFDYKAGVVQVSQDSMVQDKIYNGTLVFIQKDCPPDS